MMLHPWIRKVSPTRGLRFLTLLAVFLPVPGRAQWAPTNGLAGETVYALAANDLAVFAGTGNAFETSVATFDEGVYRTMNSGGDWSKLDIQMKTHHVSSIAVSGPTVIAGTFAGLGRSRDNGQTWSRIGTSKEVTAIAIGKTATIAGTYSGPTHRSFDQGDNWSKIEDYSMDETVYALAVLTDTVFFAGVGGAGAYISADNGTTWHPIYQGITVSGSVCFAVTGGTLFAGTLGSGVFRSQNRGIAWTRINNGLGDSVVMAIHSHGDALFAATRKGVFMSLDTGNSWVKADDGLDGIPVTTFAVYGGELFAGTNKRGVWKRPLSEMGVPVRPQVILRAPRSRTKGVGLADAGFGFRFFQGGPVELRIFDANGRALF